MGFSKSPLQLAGKMGLAAAMVATLPEAATKVAGEAAAEIIRAGSPAILRNVGRKGGARLGVRVRVFGSEAGAIGNVRASGPWQIIEFDTKAHTIPKVRKRSKGRAVRMPDGQIRSSVQHPGTKGKHPFRKGAEAAKPMIPKVYDEALVLGLGRIF